MAAKKKRGRSSRRGAGPLIAGLAGAFLVALVGLQFLPTDVEEPTPSPVSPVNEPSLRPAPGRAPVPEKRASAPAPRPAEDPGAEIPAEPPVVAVAGDGRPVERGRGRPKVAVVIDDCGYDLALMKRFARLRIPITFAVIPHLPHSEASAVEAWSAGKEVILHQPMEPEGYGAGPDPGKGALLRGMGREQVARIVRENLESIPHVSGLNNHMGSAATADSELMTFVVGAVTRLREGNPGLYFLDSRTSAASVAYDTARRSGLRTAVRSVFLDHDESLGAVRAQLEELLARADQEGEAIGIGHVKPATFTALEALSASLGTDEYDFVFASELAR